MFSGRTGGTLEILFLPRSHVHGGCTDSRTSLFHGGGDCNELPNVFLQSCIIIFSAGLASCQKSSAIFRRTLRSVFPLFFCLETSLLFLLYS
jgi:hypothetical protein